jgi:hypothetical protein
VSAGPATAGAEAAGLPAQMSGGGQGCYKEGSRGGDQAEEVGRCKHDGVQAGDVRIQSGPSPAVTIGIGGGGGALAWRQ